MDVLIIVLFEKYKSKCLFCSFFLPSF